MRGDHTWWCSSQGRFWGWWDRWCSWTWPPGSSAQQSWCPPWPAWRLWPSQLKSRRQSPCCSAWEDRRKWAGESLGRCCSTLTVSNTLLPIHMQLSVYPATRAKIWSCWSSLCVMQQRLWPAARLCAAVRRSAASTSRVHMRPPI